MNPFVIGDPRCVRWDWQPQTFGKALDVYAGVLKRREMFEGAKPQVIPGEPVSLTAEELTLVSQLADNILRRLSPRDNFFVGLGRSPSALMACLQAKVGIESACNLPFKSDLPLKDDHANLIFGHLAQFLPPADVLGDRSLVLIDFIDMGTGLDRAREWLGRFCGQVFPHCPDIYTLAISSQGDRAYYFNWELQLDEVAAAVFRPERMKVFSQYGSYHPLRHNSADLVSRWEYRALQAFFTSGSPDNTKSTGFPA